MSGYFSKLSNRCIRNILGLIDVKLFLLNLWCAVEYEKKNLEFKTKKGILDKQEKPWTEFVFNLEYPFQVIFNLQVCV